MKVSEFLSVCLGGNMNTTTLKPLAIQGLMQDYSDHEQRELKELNAELLEALEWALNNLNNYDKPSTEDIELYNKATKALKKAKGL
jgi:hypothetical protein